MKTYRCYVFQDSVSCIEIENNQFYWNYIKGHEFVIYTYTLIFKIAVNRPCKFYGRSFRTFCSLKEIAASEFVK